MDAMGNVRALCHRTKRRSTRSSWDVERVHWLPDSEDILKEHSVISPAIVVRSAIRKPITSQVIPGIP